MATGMFKGPKGALIFVGSVMFSVLVLVGSEEDEGALVLAADELGSNRDAFDRLIEDGDEPTNQPRPVVTRARTPSQPTSFDDDVELIDDTMGFDPSPEIEGPLPTSPDSNEVIIVESYGQVEVR